MGDQSLTRLQDNLNNFTNQFSDCPFLKGRMLTTIDTNGKETIAIPLTATLTSFAHKLSVPPVGYLITFKSADAVVYGSAFPRSSDSDKDFIKLQASSDVTVNIWVF